MSQRMANLESRSLEYSQSSAPTLTTPDTDDDDNSISTIRGRTDVEEGETMPFERVETMKETNKGADRTSSNDLSSDSGFTFDQDLHNSRPYARAMKRNSLHSAAASTLHTMGWSCLSDLSLADVSEISVIGLPITPQELWNGHHYILTDSDIECVSEKTQALVVDETADRGDVCVSENEKEYLETHKEQFPHNSVHSVDSSLEWGLGERRSKNVPVAAVGRPQKPKNIILLGTLQVPLSSI